MEKITRSIIKSRLEIQSETLDIIPWSTPIISFGNVNNSILATVGINPSNREFEDIKGAELNNENRRFHTLESLNIKNWNNIQESHLQRINEYCYNYFLRNPYDAWFKKLDYIISGTAKSYYFPSQEACHLDLIPWATSKKWSDLKTETQSELLSSSEDFLGDILKSSKIEVLVLNGQTVVTNLEKITQTKFIRTEVREWKLKRSNGNDIKGYKYKGYIEKIGSVRLERKILVLGFNYNIQSSFGLTKKVMLCIRNWITEELKSRL